ncbi:MAG: carbamoyltransferase C-terminal domain-containing protein [Pseudomonadota bacterium]
MSELPVYTIGLNLYHCATACLIKDGEVIGCVSEERFSRKKNQWGIPSQSIQYLLNQFDITPDHIRLVGIGGTWPTGLVVESELDSENPISSMIIKVLGKILYHARFLLPLYEWSHYNIYQRLFFPSFREKLNSVLKQKTRCSTIQPFDHHDCHMAATLFGFIPDNTNDKCLIMTLDGAGDGSCSSVNLFENDHWRPVGKRTLNGLSPALMYASITEYLGMKKMEHEYKVMGLAPYADRYGVEKVYSKLKSIFKVENDLSFGARYHSHSYDEWARKNLEKCRFDWIAGAAQKAFEDLMLTWVGKAVAATGVKKIAAGGGAFMNVKASMLVSEMDEIEQFTVCPSSGDESCAIGAAYLAYRSICRNENKPFLPRRITNLYLGPEYTDDMIYNAFEVYDFSQQILIKKCKDIDQEVANLLSDGAIVARFSNRSEWGARALGNRSILANPSDLGVVRILNEQIKNRDFWMPFAASILKERETDYIINPKGLDAQFMIMAFRTTQLAQNDLKASLHPYDQTIRPQIVEKMVNPSYHRLISLFMEKTKIGGVLNTSFNIHGDPIVNSPYDAFYTLDNSGLRHLAIGSYLLTKRKI